MKTKTVTFTHISKEPGEYSKAVRVSEDLAIYFNPDLHELVEKRDFFFRIAHGSLYDPKDQPLPYWLQLQREAQAVIDRLCPQVCI